MDTRKLLVGTFSALSFAAIAGACVQTPSIDNDRFASNLGGDAGGGSSDEDDSDDSTDDDDTVTPVANADTGAPVVKDAGKPPTNTPPSQSSDAGTQTPPTTQAPPNTQTPPVSEGGGSAPVEATPDPEPDTAEPPPPPAMMSVVPGSATKAKCTSYTKVSGTMCGGYFCGVTQEQIAAEMPADTLCGENAIQGACDNKLPTAVAKCAREVKSANALASNAQNRPKVQDCVFKDADLKENTPLPCMSCFLDAAECAGDNCLVECLAGDSKNCDACRAKNKCDLKVFTCAKLISPF
jgi:hypothetical protein